MINYSGPPTLELETSFWAGHPTWSSTQSTSASLTKLSRRWKNSRRRTRSSLKCWRSLKVSPNVPISPWRATCWTLCRESQDTSFCLQVREWGSERGCVWVSMWGREGVSESVGVCGWVCVGERVREWVGVWVCVCGWEHDFYMDMQSKSEERCVCVYLFATYFHIIWLTVTGWDYVCTCGVEHSHCLNNELYHRL